MFAEAGKQGGGVSAAADITPAEDPRDCWRTPRKLFDLLNERFSFDLDGAADHENHLCQAYWDAGEGGIRCLADPVYDNWRVFINPPYRNIAPWVGAAFRRGLRGGFSALLLPVCTDQIWWHEFALRGEVRFFVGRIAFDPPPGIAASSNRGPSCLVVFDKPSLCARAELSINHKTGWIG